MALTDLKPVYEILATEKLGCGICKQRLSLPVLGSLFFRPSRGWKGLCSRCFNAAAMAVSEIAAEAADRVAEPS